MHPIFRFSAVAAIALAISPIARAQEGPSKNLTNLSAFQGNFFGKSVVTADGEKFRGRAKLRANIDEDGLGGTLRIDGAVRVDGERVPIDNRFRFKKSGRVAIDHLAPAVSNAKVKGFYTAQPTDVSFQGRFDVGAVEGSYTCRVRISVKRIVRMTYSVTIGDDTAPSFIYDFVAEPKSEE